MKQVNNNKIIFLLVLTLFCFLPLSSWIISLTGFAGISLLRDLLCFIIFVLALLGMKSRVATKPFLLFALLFILWGGLSFFWREASLMQWLKGFRFTFVPVVLFVSLSLVAFSSQQKKILLKVLLGGGIIIFFAALLEFLGFHLPLVTSWSGAGALEATHYVGATKIMRLQAILAGPNALGLYMLALSSVAIYAESFLGDFKLKKWLFPVFIIILLLTFSRSSILGLGTLLLIAGCYYFGKKWGIAKVFVTLTITLALLVALIYGGIKSNNSTIKNLIQHNDSSSLRVEQYWRIWQSRNEIGLLGRGSGTAGPSSQYRLDGGENHWTENIYLDIFEELGLVGLLLYLGLLISLGLELYKQKQTWARGALLAISSFFVAGFFINYYTGQVGIFIMWLVASLAATNSINYGEDDEQNID